MALSTHVAIALHGHLINTVYMVLLFYFMTKSQSVHACQHGGGVTLFDWLHVSLLVPDEMKHGAHGPRCQKICYSASLCVCARWKLINHGSGGDAAAGAAARSHLIIKLRR
jgi:hypothetical protein